jgi:hypothetical protein
MSTIKLGIPRGMKWPVVGWKNGTIRLAPGFLQELAEANDIPLESITDEAVGDLLWQWYTHRRAAGEPVCVHMEMMQAQVADDIVDGADDY